LAQVAQPMAASLPPVEQPHVKHAHGARRTAASLPPRGAPAAALRARSLGRGGTTGIAHNDRRSASVSAARRSSGDLVGLDAVLFLDVDGVLHPFQARHPRQQFLEANMELLGEVLRIVGAKVVLSTAWRLDPYTRKIVGEKLAEHGLPGFVSCTPSIAQFHRAREILSWVKRFRPVTWVAVDDWPLLEDADQIHGHFVQTKPRFGLQRDTAARIIELFNMQNKGGQEHFECRQDVDERSSSSQPPMHESKSGRSLLALRGSRTGPLSQ